MHNNYIAARNIARVQLWLTLANKNSEENISVNYTFCLKNRKRINKISLKKYVYKLYYVSMVDIIII